MPTPRGGMIFIKKIPVLAKLRVLKGGREKGEHLQIRPQTSSWRKCERREARKASGFLWEQRLAQEGKPRQWSRESVTRVQQDNPGLLAFLARCVEGVEQPRTKDRRRGRGKGKTQPRVYRDSLVAGTRDCF